MAQPVNLALLPWNVIDTIVAFVDDVRLLGRLASMHSAFDTALDYDPLWENLCRQRHRPVHDAMRGAHVDSWRRVLRLELTKQKQHTLGALITQADDLTPAQRDTLNHALDLSFSGWWCLGASGVSTLSSALAKDCMLCSLDLSSQMMGDEGLAHVRTIVDRAPHLESLSLDENSLTDKGATALLGIVRKAPHLRSLSLRRNYRLTAAFATTLAPALQGSALRSLALTDTSIGAKGAAAIIDVFATRQGTSSVPITVKLDLRGVRVEGHDEALTKALVHLAAVTFRALSDMAARRAKECPTPAARRPTEPSLVDLREGVASTSRNPNSLNAKKVLDALKSAAIPVVSNGDDAEADLRSPGMCLLLSAKAAKSECCVC
jgi:hypothetical protein